MRYQEGGLAAALEEDEEPLDPMQGYLSLLASQYQTSPEAQQYSRSILEQVLDPEAFAAEEEAFERYQETAEESRQALQAARERVLAEKFDPRDKWLAAAAAFGTPTRTGHFGETLGNVAQAIRGPISAEREFEKERSERLLELDEALGGMDQASALAQLKMAKERRTSLGDLGKEALKTLGKTIGKTPPASAGSKRLDQAMATELSTWELQGAADAAKSISEMNEAVDALKGTSDLISGSIVGLAPKEVRDIILPESGNVQDLIETTAQRSLKAVLGGQFGQREGEMLLARTFNPRLDESQNYRRAFRLLKMLQEATAQKNRALNHFKQYGTMQGFQGKTAWDYEDFEPEPLMISVRMADGNIFEVPEGTTKGEALQLYEEYREGKEKKAKGGRVKGFKKKKKSPQFHIRRYSEGGVIDIDELEEERGGMDVDPLDILLSGVGTVTGAGVGAGGVEAEARLRELSGELDRGTSAERRVAEAMEVGGVDPEEAMLEVRRGRRMGVPETPLDVSGRPAKILGEQALMAGGEEAEGVLSELEARHAGSRERVARQVEKGLRTPEFFDTEEKLTTRLYERAKPLYQQAYKENPSVKEPKVLQEIFQSPDGKKAVQIALRLMQNQGKKIGKEDAVGLVRRPSLEFLDNVKKGLDQLIRQYDMRAGGPNPMSHSIKGLRSKLLAYLDNPDNVTPTYAKARQQYKGDLEILQALDMGKGEFLRMPSEQARRELSAMSPNERDALRTGVSQKIYETIYGPTTDIAAARRIIGSPEMVNRLELLFDKPSEFRIFKAALEREMALFEQGKKTVRRAESGRTQQMTQELLERGDPLARVKEVAGRNPFSPVMWVTRFLETLGGKKKFRLGEDEADEIVRILNTGDLKELETLGTRLKKVGSRVKKVRGRKGKAALVGAAIGAALAPFLDTEDQEEEIVGIEELED